MLVETGGGGKTPETYGGRKFIASNPRKARGLGAPRGRRVGRAPNRRSSTTRNSGENCLKVL